MDALLPEIQYQYFNGYHLSQDILRNLANSVTLISGEPLPSTGITQTPLNLPLPNLCHF